jgi:hypothetical protein
MGEDDGQGTETFVVKRLQIRRDWYWICGTASD